MILNIMPCVLPVVALKIMGFVGQSRSAPGRVRNLGLIYGAGVVISFLVLAGIVIGVNAVGQKASWGMQLQNTPFVVLMTVLVTLIALNLFGVFEVVLGGGAMDAAGSLASREGAPGAFFNGVLATALATPCTAPFLGAALGFAFGQPPAIILLVFVVVGAGMAFPYVLLSWHPGWLRFLPRPGAWMERFKNLMGFPMLATAIWLASLAVEALGPGSVLWVGLLLVMVALTAWIWGEFWQRGRKRSALVIALVLAVVTYGYILEGQLRWRAPIQPVPTADIIRLHTDGIEWRRWSPEAVASARAEGRPVLVDFTASWCLTCQVNAKTSLEIAEVKARLKAINAVALIENSFKKNAQVVAELNRHGRAGVPLVLVYSKDLTQPPQVLPELLTPRIVLEALDKAVK
jgi:thiol:disulfide interchange protein DsbD